MKKFVLDLKVKSVEKVHERYVLIRLTDEQPLPEMQPGQFVEVRVDGSPATFLRRPISINFVDRQANELWLLVACVGDGTRRLAQLQPGDTLNCMLPLGNGWTLPQPLPVWEGSGHTHAQSLSTPLPHREGLGESRLLVGGGVGVAPLLYLGAVLRQSGVEPTFLLGARSKKDLLMLQEFEKYGRVLVTTEDGSLGERGFVTNHSVLQQEHFDLIQCCGPTPMMKAVARYARQSGTACEVSLENLMACGLGACLCCVEKVKTSPNPSEGGEFETSNLKPETTNVCVCKEGPVFNINRLLWQD